MRGVREERQVRILSWLGDEGGNAREASAELGIPVKIVLLELKELHKQALIDCGRGSLVGKIWDLTSRGRELL